MIPLPGASKPKPATNSNGGNTNNKLCHIDVADANRCNTNNLLFGEGNATLRRCSEVNVKRAIAHDYSATIPPLEIIAYSVTAKVYGKRNLSGDSVRSNALDPSGLCAAHFASFSHVGRILRQLVPHQEE